MAFLLFIVGGLQVLGGALALLSAASAIHEILGAVAIGMGFLCIGLASIVMRLTDVVALLAPARDVVAHPHEAALERAEQSRPPLTDRQIDEARQDPRIR